MTERRGDNSRRDAKLKINLGCGLDIRPGYVNHDLSRHSPGVDVAHDLTRLPWPWPDHSAEEMLLIDVLEHLPEVVPVIDECWRIMDRGGLLRVRVPHYEHWTAWLDPTHRRPFHPDSFDYFDPETHYGASYGFYTDRKWRVESKRVEDGNVVVTLRSRFEEEVAWAEALAAAAARVTAAVPRGTSYVLVDDNHLVEWTDDTALPFLERNGEYWGAPVDDATAMRELERLRAAGAQYMVFSWPAMWWLEHYAAFDAHLRSQFRCIQDGPDLVVFDITATPR